MPEYLERAREYQPWEPPPTGETGWPDWTPGFKWPWETPPGQGFQAPWTNINPLAPMQTMEPGGLNYGPYDDPGQIPEELLNLYDWETYDQSYIDENGKTAKVTMYRLIPKATEGMDDYEKAQLELAWAKFSASQAGGVEGMTEKEQRYLELAEEKARRDYEQTLWQRAQAGDPQAMSEWQQWQTEFLPWQAKQEYGLQQQQLDLERQQQLANLAAHPIDWLQYEALKGQPPVVQPWMLPLMSQQYPELADLQAGQPIPGWGGQGGQMPTGGIPPQATGGYPSQPQMPGYQPFQPTGGQVPTPGLGEMLQGGQMAMPGLDQLMSKYQGMGLSQQEAEQEALHELAYLRWRSIPSGQGTQEKRTSFLEMGQIGAERPETQQRYQQAIEAAQSGQPLLGGLSSREKLALVGQLIEQGMDRTLAERQVFGGGMFDKYTPVEDIGRTPTPTTPRREPTPTRPPPPSGPGWIGERPEIPKQEPKKVPAYMPGRSWHMIDDPLRSQTSGIRERFDIDPRQQPKLGKLRPTGTPPTVHGLPPNIPGQPTPTIGQPQPWIPGVPTPTQPRPTITGQPNPYIPGVPTPNQPRPGPQVEELPMPWIPGVPTPTQPTPGSRGPIEPIPYIPGVPTPTRPPAPSPYTPTPNQPTPGSWGPGMPGLLNPSAQLWSRMGPTAQQMYLGYQQAASGIRPEEMAWRMWSMAPPGGRHPGLSYAR